MTRDDFIKNVKIAVDASDWLKVEKITKAYINSLKLVNEQLQQEQTILKKLGQDEARQAEITREIGENLKDQVNLQKDLFKLQEKINEEKIKALDKQLDRERQRQEWEKGKTTFSQKIERYKGVTGLGTLAQDILAKKTSGTLFDVDKRIAELEEQNKQEGISEEKKIENQEKIENFKDTRAKIIGESKTTANRISSITKTIANVGTIIHKTASALGLSFTDLAQQSLEVAAAFLNLKTGAATFATSSSLITNSTAREQQMKYGLSTSKNFALTQSMSMLGMQNDEDLMYMNSEQRSRFMGYMERYSQWYDRLEQSGVLRNVQEMQLEFQELKQQLGMELLEFIAANKDVIMTCIKGIFVAVRGIAELVLKIVAFFSRGNSTNNVFNINSTTNNNGGYTSADLQAKNMLTSTWKETAQVIGG